MLKIFFILSFDDPEAEAHKAESKCPVSRLLSSGICLVAKCHRSEVTLHIFHTRHHLDSLGFSHSQVVNKGDLPKYEIDTGETTKYVSPDEVAKLVFHKMKGNV